MANLYLDFTNGNDSNNGTSFALRCKTITSGITAARTAPGDVIRIMKSEDPVSLGINATFTDLSETVTLASALTTNLYTTNAWTASTNVTCATTPTRKEGTDSASISIAAGFTTGKVAYYATGTLNLSGYTKCSFWIRATATVAASVFSFKLCTDTIGDTPAHTFTITQILNSGVWTCITFDNAGALNSSIKSIAIYALSDPGVVALSVDNVLACNDLTLTCVIGLSSSPTSHEFYTIKSINGTTIKLDGGTNSAGGTVVKGWSGTTTTATCYKIEPILPSNFNNTIQEGGSTSVRSLYSGGWDETAMTTQTGLTFIDTRNATNAVLSCTQTYVNFENIVVVRGSGGFSITTTNQNFYNCASLGSAGVGFNIASRYILLDTCTSLNNATHGINISTQNNKLINCITSNNTSNGINLTSYGSEFKDIVACNNGGAGVFVSAAGCEINGLIARSNTTYPLTTSLSSGASVNAYNVTSSGHTVGLIAQTGTLTATNIDITDTIPYSTTIEQGILMVNNEAGDENFSRIYYKNDTTITAQLEATTLHGNATKNWKHIPQNNNTIYFPQIQKINRIPVSATGTLIFSVWVQRSSTNVDAMLFLKGGQCTGVMTDLSSTTTAAINTWEQLSISCTPGQATSLEFELRSWRNNTSSGDIFFSDFTCIQS